MMELSDKSRFLLECDHAVGLPAVLKLIAVLEADHGITVPGLATMLKCGGTAAKSYIKAAATRGWLFKTNELRDGAAVYRRTDRGNLLTLRLIC